MPPSVLLRERVLPDRHVVQTFLVPNKMTPTNEKAVTAVFIYKAYFAFF